MTMASLHITEHNFPYHAALDIFMYESTLIPY